MVLALCLRCDDAPVLIAYGLGGFLGCAAVVAMLEGSFNEGESGKVRRAFRSSTRVLHSAIDGTNERERKY